LRLTGRRRVPYRVRGAGLCPPPGVGSYFFSVHSQKFQVSGEYWVGPGFRFSKPTRPT
jgi:hypothetical protein